MYKLIITSTENGTLLLSGVGSNELSLLQLSRDWVISHGYSSSSVTVCVTGLFEQTLAAVDRTKGRYFQKPAAQIQAVPKVHKHIPQMRIVQTYISHTGIVAKYTHQLRLVPKYVPQMRIVAQQILVKQILHKEILAAEIYN
jgi:hypothetical protein